MGQAYRIINSTIVFFMVSIILLSVKRELLNFYKHFPFIKTQTYWGMIWAITVFKFNLRHSIHSGFRNVACLIGLFLLHVYLLKFRAFSRNYLQDLVFLLISVLQFLHLGYSNAYVIESKFLFITRLKSPPTIMCCMFRPSNILSMKIA